MKARRGTVTSGLGLLLVPPRVEASLWRRFRYERETRCREQIFTRYRGLARSIALRQLRVRPRNGIELRDMEQFAYEGLLVAIDRFDPLRGIPFGAFARRRIIGSIADGTSRMSEIDAQYSYRRRVEAERLRSIATGGDNIDALAALAELAAGLAVGLILEGTGLIEPEDGADRRPGAYESLAWRQLQTQLVQEIDRLPEREGVIVRQHYENGVSFAQIAQLLGLSRGRVSQLHASAIGKLRTRMGYR
ncbi:sigma-70 family RNA polymerase sigma factor [Sphingomonas sp. NIBR02145]|uniref:sigma-70 family RNA polymerase sigma factor n=1 Tax=Sphingomonas sp. NIBR02145 TaxID=3014784 RepID=UPI0022B55770|nr:sigma-70 family RNA polymerase sigma factor [Sphingomonas sp. NIBR02145]WHU04992.1 sigma-70 family RNA polymerase sigma factor [Sphingomonas sp. NIBR02145]